ncbi:DNA repair protein RecO [Halomicronema hongdechloris C2206]|uniref:DNA repair protein RecO n=1 Tax=Halomicronema hongdechloris C2206 TaxID=1641165 RepID=A0A1Z3HLD0_9CYAN|nr:DNA repair protein RecO [Halomicronema hongdechloris]ASC71098.1 DNA repair protein RecO [Halomicronema hongdechloris C2206]
MSRTYKATGINLKSMPMGETDRLVTILSPQVGVIRVVAPGSRKHHSRLGGRSGLFVINELLVVKGRRLDKLTQAETVRSFPGLSQHLGKLTASQYLAELVLFQALSNQPQEDLFYLLVEHLERLETATSATVLASLVQGIFHLLAIAGVAPEVQHCCITRELMQPNLLDPTWRIGFSPTLGGIVHLDQLATVPSRSRPPTMAEGQVGYDTVDPSGSTKTIQLTALELALLQQLSQPHLRSASGAPETAPHWLWYRLERLLRQYAEYHFDRPLRSATLIDTCFGSPVDTSSVH